MNIYRLIAIIKKEFIHIFRDKASLFIIFMIPIIFTLIFGYTISTEVDNIKIAILDNDKTIESNKLINSLINSNYFKLYEYVQNMEDINNLISSNIVKSALIIPNGYSNLSAKKTKPLLIIDGTDPTVAQTALQSGRLVANMNHINNSDKFEDQINTKVWYNPNLKSSNFIVPGLIGIVMQNITIMLTAFSLVREREKGNLELLIVSPIKSLELILGKIVPYIVIGFLDFLVALFLGTMIFSINIQGSLFLLLILGFIFVICSLSIGMLISTISRNQLQAMQLTFITLLPTVLLSGFMFPVQAMPETVQFISKLIPVTYFITILRGIILKGTNINLLINESVILIAFSTILLLLAVNNFKKSLD